MAHDLANEDAFETEIAEYLARHGWLYSSTSEGYDRTRALYPADVFGWLQDTQPQELAKVVKAGSAGEAKQRTALLDRLVKALDKPLENGGGTLNVLRRPVGHTDGGSASLRMCQFRPATTLNADTTERYQKVRLRVMRQVTYSAKSGNSNRIDMVFFINGLPVATLELKTFLKQKVVDAVEQYKQDRNPAGEPLLTFGARALVHFAVDDDEVWMTTRLAGWKTRFLPFNKGTLEGGAGNPPNPGGAPTAYLWEQVLQRDSWLNILGALMFVKSEVDTDPIEGKPRKRTSIIFPRFHQWDVVTKVLDTVRVEGTGGRFLIQHSAGSGKTNSIAWTAHRLARLHDADNEKVFDKVLVITDRKVLDKQLADAVRQVDNTADLVTTIGSTEVRLAGSKSAALAAALTDQSLVVVVTIQTFPFVMDRIDTDTALAGKRFAIMVDEAHTSQSGATAAKLREIISEGGVVVGTEGNVDAEDLLNATLKARSAARASATNVSYFAFTATPKQKTVDLFGRPDSDGTPRAFHVYSMRQAIEEGFILDVLRGYQTYTAAFEIQQKAKGGVDASAPDDPDSALVDEKAAARGIMRFAKLHSANIGQKVQVIVEHFNANVAHLLEGHAKAMVVTDSRKAAVRYKVEIDRYIAAKGYDLKTLVAFSESVDDNDPTDESATGLTGASEATLNKGVGTDLAEAFKAPQYRVMIVADKFQTGFDQPLLCAMYVDKRLPDVHAVQTLSRLNRTYTSPSGERKDATFILDFVNEAEDILKEFRRYYREAQVEHATDPNLVHDLSDKLAQADVYTDTDVEEYARAWFNPSGKHSALVDPIKRAKDKFADRLHAARDAGLKDEVDTLGLFRRDVSAFVRLYDFMSQVVDYADTFLEKLQAFLRQLTRVLDDDQLDRSVDLTGLTIARAVVRPDAAHDMTLGGEDGSPVRGITSVGGGTVHEDPNLVLLQKVIDRINELFGGGLEPEQVRGFVEPVVATAEQNPSIQVQIDNNAEDQFLGSPDLRDVVIDAALDLEGAMGQLIAAATGDDERAAEMVQLLGRLMYQRRRSAPPASDTA